MLKARLLSRRARAELPLPHQASKPERETLSTRHSTATGKQAFSVSMKSNLTRSPWRRRPSLFLGFLAPSATAEFRAATPPVLRVRCALVPPRDLALLPPQSAAPNASVRSRRFPLQALSC